MEYYRLLKLVILLSTAISFSSCIILDKASLKDDPSQGKCQTRTCQQVTEQAESLLKLSLLPDFVSQTLILLHELMQDMDTEMSKSANSMLKYIGPECGETYDILQEIIQKQRSRSARASSDMSFGIGKVTQDSMLDKDDATITTSQQVKKQQNVDLSSKSGHLQDTVDDDDMIWSYEGQQISSWQPVDKQGQQLSGSSSHSTKQNSQQSSYGSSHQLGHGSGSNQGHHSSSSSQSFQSSRTSSSNSLGGTGASQSSHGDGWNQSHLASSLSQGHTGTKAKQNLHASGSSQGYGSSSSKSLHGTHGSHGSSWTYDRGTSSLPGTCRGVDKTSPFWVPGLDQWCNQNCSQGYCPRTHCIC